jgi:hypothetical protein
MAGSRYDDMTLEELREEAKSREMSGVWEMNKPEIVSALQRSSDRGSERSGGGAGGKESSSLKYAQRVDSADEHEERPGKTLVTQDHETIRRWAEERGAVPATIAGTEHDDHLGVLTFDFGGDSEDDRLRHVSWDEWFRTFDERGLRFIYQEHLKDGSQSNFFRLENPDREDA